MPWPGVGFQDESAVLPDPHRLFDSRRVLATVTNLARTLGAEVATASNTEVEEELVLMITVMDTETFAKRLKRYVPETLARHYR